MTQKIVRVNSLADDIDPEPTYLALGSFDGVHKGHQAVIGEMVEAARKAGARSAVLTFFPHPRRVLQDLQDRFYINTLPDREKLLAQLGVDLVVTHPFNEQVRQIRAVDFINQLRDELDMQQIWGGNFAFGYKREGDVSFLQRLGSENGFSVRLVDSMVEWDGKPVSSSRVRESLSAGNFSDVNGCLGRSYSLHGIVVKGDQRGRTIGFPTANLALWAELLLPTNGVYATYAWAGDQRYKAATNIGVRPTIDGGDRVVEAHLLDFDGDLYGQDICLEFVKYLRPEKKFSGLEALKEQINHDVTEVRQLL
jgi:riboflavin kinase / FMN adenylyltransferase